MTNASLRGALNLRAEGEWLKIDWMSLENQSDTLEVLDSGTSLLRKKLVLRPMELFRDSLRWKGNIKQVAVHLGHDLLTDEPGDSLNRPLRAPENFDWQSEYGLLVKGTDLSRQKDYKEAEVYLMKALAKNPNLVPALSQMAQIKFREGLYEMARAFAGKALAVDTYDPAANYFWGLSNEKTGSDADALDGFSVATLSPEFRKAAWLRIAYLNIRKKNWKEAENLINKCVAGYPPDENAIVVKAMIDRKLGNSTAAINSLNELLAVDPLNHFARFEKYMNTGADQDKNDFVRYIRQEMPHETFIGMAIRYYEWNLERESLRILDLAPVHPMVQLWQAWLLERAGMQSKSDDKLILSMSASPELVFPFRPEMTELFSWAYKQKPDWKWHYYKALILWQNNQIETAKSLFDSCGTQPDFVPFYLAKAELFRDDSLVAGSALEKAYQLDPLQWRTGYRLAQHYISQKQLDAAGVVTAQNYKVHPSSFIVGLQHAQVLKLGGRYSDALDVLSRLQMLPAEGDVNAHSLFRETNILLALEYMKTGKWKKAVVTLNKAETWPENLFSGEPYLPDNRVTQFMRSYCFQKLKIPVEAEKSFTYIKEYKNPDGQKYTSGNRLTDFAESGSRDYKMITTSILNGVQRDRDLEVLKAFLEIL
jgi:tetratricopeptide (TPR) repeat protein